MLKALYDYAQSHKLVPPAGYIPKTVKVWIHLDAQGAFEYIEPVDNQTVIAPDIGSLAKGDKCNVLLEKRSIVLPERESAKSRFFLNALREAATVEPVLGACEKALSDKKTVSTIRQKLDELRIMPSDFVCFKVDGVSVLELSGTMEWWSCWRSQYQKKAKEPSLCLITGETTFPILTTTPIKGLNDVGGHSSGDALICFNKEANAYESYNLKQSANAPVSEEAFAAVKAALDKLIADSPTLAGMKFVHWYDSETTDIINQALGLEDWDEEDVDEEEDDLTEEEIRLEEQREEISHNRQATRLVESVRDGGDAVSLGDAHYFILMLTGVGGRIMVRHYERGNYEELRQNLKQWKKDLKMTNSFGTGFIKSNIKLNARLFRLVNYQKGDRKTAVSKKEKNERYERMQKELSGLTPAILWSIIKGRPLPDPVAVRALASIRSEIMASEEEQDNNTIAFAFQWLKIWLLRNNRKKGKPEELMEEYNWEHSVPAYHFGGMMAVYAAIQRESLKQKDSEDYQGAADDNKQKKGKKQVKVSILQTYFSSAMQTPAFVLGQLGRRSVHHLDKIDNTWLVNKFMDYLQRLSVAAGHNIPATLTLPEQSYFALGYYQMGALMQKERREKAAEKRAKAQNTDMEG